MDEVDREILDHLKRDGRASFTDIAEKVGVSEGTVRNRVDKMERNSVIEHFTVETSDTGMSAIVMARLSTEREISDIVGDLPDELEVYEVTGDHDLVFRASRNSTEALNDAIDDIRAVKGVEETRTYSVLKSHRL